MDFTADISISSLTPPQSPFSNGYQGVLETIYSS